MPAPGRSTSAAAACMPVTPGGETQREMSFRVGVNLVMHALTGNYKGRHGPPARTSCRGCGDEPDLRRLRRLRSAAAAGRCWPCWAAIGLVLVLLGLRAGARGTVWRLGSVVVVLAALANPSLIEEQRKPIADVALVVVDDQRSRWRSASAAPQVQAAREALKKQARPAGRASRCARPCCRPSHIQLGSERPGGTRLIETMRSALVEVPPERLAGVVLLTDGQVHDVPRQQPAARAGRRARACPDRRQEGRARPADRDRSSRRASAWSAARSPPSSGSRIPPGGTAPVTPVGRRRGGAPARRAGRLARSSCRSPSAIPAPTSSSSRWRPARTSSRSTTTAPSSPSTACATGCACCWSRASPTRASGRGGTC